jgi:hypothetical protein
MIERTHFTDAPWLLHVRARRVPILLIGLGVIALAGWGWAEWLVSRPRSLGPIDRLPVSVVAPLLAAVLVCDGLAHIDDDLEGSTPIRWRLMRLVHLVAALVLTGTVVTVIGLWEPRTYGAFEMARNTAGFHGLVALSTTILGARLAWTPVVMYGVAVIAMVPRPIEEAGVWWTWPVQPWGVTGAVWAAAGVLVCGGAMYVLLGARRSHDAVES